MGRGHTAGKRKPTASRPGPSRASAAPKKSAEQNLQSSTEYLNIRPAVALAGERKGSLTGEK